MRGSSLVAKGMNAGGLLQIWPMGIRELWKA